MPNGASLTLVPWSTILQHSASNYNYASFAVSQIHKHNVVSEVFIVELSAAVKEKGQLWNRQWISEGQCDSMASPVSVSQEHLFDSYCTFRLLCFYFGLNFPAANLHHRLYLKTNKPSALAQSSVHRLLISHCGNFLLKLLCHGEIKQLYKVLTFIFGSKDISFWGFFLC